MVSNCWVSDMIIVNVSLCVCVRVVCCVLREYQLDTTANLMSDITDGPGVIAHMDTKSSRYNYYCYYYDFYHHYFGYCYYHNYND